MGGREIFYLRQDEVFNVATPIGGVTNLTLHEQGRVNLGGKGLPSDFRSMPLDVGSGRHIQ